MGKTRFYINDKIFKINIKIFEIECVTSKKEKKKEIKKNLTQPTKSRKGGRKNDANK